LHAKRRWWRGRRRKDRVGQPTRIDASDRQEVERRKAKRAPWQVWSRRYITILFLLVALSILFVAAVYAFPGARLTFHPQVTTIEVKRQIVADPELSGPAGGASVPGRVLSSVQTWRAEVATTGLVDVNDAPARGEVVFVNLLDQPATVPTGTRVSTSAGERILFQTVSNLEIPGVVGGSARVEVVAVEPGPKGNVAAALVNRIEGPLAPQLQVRNLEAMAGGGVRAEAAVSEADVDRLRSQIMQQLQVRALAEMEGQLTDREFLAKDSLRVFHVLQETNSAFPGEQAVSLAMEIRAELQATAVDEAEAVALVYQALTDSVPAGAALVPESLDFHSGRVLGVDNQGRVTFDMVAQGSAASEIDVEDALTAVAGQDRAVALDYLAGALPLRQRPEAVIWPLWFGRFPYLPIRIQTEIDTGI
jgi:hypothetical protein